MIELVYKVQERVDHTDYETIAKFLYLEDAELCCKALKKSVKDDPSFHVYKFRVKR